MITVNGSFACFLCYVLPTGRFAFTLYCRTSGDNTLPCILQFFCEIEMTVFFRFRCGREPLGKIVPHAEFPCRIDLCSRIFALMQSHETENIADMGLLSINYTGFCQMRRNKDDAGFGTEYDVSGRTTAIPTLMGTLMPTSMLSRNGVGSLPR